MAKEIMIIGATSDVAQALVHLVDVQTTKLWLVARNVDRLEPLKTHVKITKAITIELVESDVCAFEKNTPLFTSIAPTIDEVYFFAGYLGEQEKAEKDPMETLKIIQTNFTGAVLILNIFAEAFAKRKSGTIVGISSVAGDRGRGSNYIYGSAKAGLSVYLDGMRQRLAKVGVHVTTAKPGFMATRMTKDLDLPKSITTSPEKAASIIFKAAKRKKNTIYVSTVWRFIMLVIRNIPEFIFKRLSI